MSKKIDDTDQSYELGRFVGIMRQMEEELKFVSIGFESLVESALQDFVTAPSETLDECQIQLIQTQKKISALGRPDLLEDIRNVFELIDVPYLMEVTLHESHFIEGYESQKRAYHQ